MTQLHVLHHDDVSTYYDCRLGWRIDASARTLVVHKPGGRWLIPLDSVRSIEVEYKRPPTEDTIQAEPLVLVTTPTQTDHHVIMTLERWRSFVQWEERQKSSQFGVVDLSDPSDDLIEFENKIADRMGDNFDGDEGQQAIILRWLDAVGDRMLKVDPKGYAYYFASGPHPDADEDDKLSPDE